MNNLNEASVWDPKYPTGYKFSFSSSIAKGSKNKLDIINNASKFKYGSNDVFTKADITDNALDINFGGKPGIPYYIKSERTKEVLRVQGAGSGSIFIKMSGSKRVLPPGITPTAFLETFAVLSIMGVSNYEEALRYKDKELMIDLSKFEGINTALKEEINDILKNTSKLGSPKSFIHKSIDNYYAALKAYETDVRQLKTNTSDAVVIYEGSYSDVMKALKEGWAILDDPAKDGMIIFSDTNGTTVKFKQISLKIGKDGARLGRITSIIKNFVDFDDFDDMDLNESIEPIEVQTYDYPTIPSINLDEGFKAFINKAVNLGKLSIKAFNTARKTLLSMLNKIRSVFMPKNFKSTLDKDTKRFFRMYPQFASLNENLTDNLLSKTLDELLSVIKVQGDKLISVTSNLDMVTFYSNMGTVDKRHAMKDKAIYNLLVCNAISLITLQRLLPGITEQGAANHVANIIDVMRRGSTALPVIVAYSDGSNYEVLQKIPPVTPHDVIPSVVSVLETANKSSHYVINVYYLVELNPIVDESLYVKIQMTNAAGDRGISWKVEGNNADTRFKAIKKFT